MDDTKYEYKPTPTTDAVRCIKCGIELYALSYVYGETNKIMKYIHGHWLKTENYSYGPFCNDCATKETKDETTETHS